MWAFLVRCIPSERALGSGSNILHVHICVSERGRVQAILFLQDFLPASFRQLPSFPSMYLSLFHWITVLGPNQQHLSGSACDAPLDHTPSNWLKVRGWASAIVRTGILTSCCTFKLLDQNFIRSFILWSLWSQKDYYILASQHASVPVHVPPKRTVCVPSFLSSSLPHTWEKKKRLLLLLLSSMVKTNRPPTMSAGSSLSFILRSSPVRNAFFQL